MSGRTKEGLDDDRKKKTGDSEEVREPRVRRVQGVESRGSDKRGSDGRFCKRSFHRTLKAWR